MEQKQVITVWQLFGMLYISRMIVNITYNPFMASNGEVIDHVLSAAASFLLTFVMILPVYLLNRKEPTLNLIDHSVYLLGRGAVVVSLLYAVYFVLAGCYTLSFFNTFVDNVMSPKTSLVLLSAAVMITAVYGAIRGAEALARASGIILIGIIAAFVFVACALLPKVDPLNYTPVFYEEGAGFSNGILMMLSYSTGIPVLAILLPLAKGNWKKGFFAWNFAVYLTIAVLLLLMEGALGEYLKTQIFPIYAATSAAEIGMFKRLDALYLGIWTTGLFVKMALFLIAISHSLTRVLGKKAGKISIFICGTVIAGASALIAGSRSLAQWVYDFRFLLYGTLAAGLVIPLIVYFAVTVKKRREAGPHAA